MISSEYIIETMNEALFIVKIGGEIEMANAFAHRLLGYEANELTGKDIDTILLEEDTPVQGVKFGDYVMNFTPNKKESFLLSKGMKKIPVSFTASIIQEPDSDIQKIICIAQDMADWKQVEETLRAHMRDCVLARAASLSMMEDAMEAREMAEAAHAKLQKLNLELEERTAQLQAANKELEAFSYSVSHDLRSPLRAINGFSNALLDDYNDKLDGQGKDYLHRIRKASQNMGVLIDAILKLSRTTRCVIHSERVNMSALAEETAAGLRQLHSDRTVIFRITPGMEAMGDKVLLRQVLENLLDNAWKFTEKQPRAEIIFDTTEQDGKQVFFVKDNGAGFDMAYAEKLFTPFQRLHSEQEFPGVGVGLANVQRIITRHNGRIWAEGWEGKGATFYFTMQL
ncbi:MAG: hypothetical protein A2268_07565 [Candidatus Raymondbacteria bacterium RifOxyA12_full_50_37]|uniref:histidine kinase n=1 Tax=Candidatus Raymondbacteria bacterium RIFOXYD12_FULL_49_13 TaxID=1817890 RepID=A0A1F7F3B4_UNCRA|nr:MAG: hypothetical protein A2248_05175 [Candidatus Raymondbacteria bacterium RIFOXYA2_FULL_49_16]OGJ90102.1 MAG: hypothetical protein A2268_07565 [Candidatus Raymondbacteria bacterium RifOxyA12_full_50_37]OGJ94663.1 MAG: hypothetical protein A2350_08450 [Candidatus Raymondbacteria bacterium RifOxyB12_full_50_8]OGJ97680.1 MAG: hypothetical protein A2453_09535 [Candidatus Raymondbacteria bacterium RIFOXYC2_FULL_50_21]OGJ98891.1 MAG: hypothetical protein A2487_19500 [Candidatus Raymondbacteria b